MQVDFITQPADLSQALRKLAEKTETTAAVKNQPKDAAQAEKPVPAEKLSKIQSVFAEHNINLKFSQDKDTNQIVVELVDADTGEEIRQTPSEVSLKLAAVTEKIQGQFIDKQL